MSLLLLFAYPNPASVSVSELVTTQPVATNGAVIQLDAVPSGDWRFVLELADPSEGSDALWRDITDYYAGDRHQFGADDYMGDARARLVSVELQIDDSDLLAPWGQDTSPLFGVDVLLDAGLLMRASMTRVVDSTVVEWLPLWTGRVESWGDASAARGQIRTHVVSVIDTMSDLANVPTNPGFAVTWDLWFTDLLLPQAGWLFDVDIYGDTSSSGLLGDDTSYAAAINRMDQGTDPLGLVWRTLRTGRMVIHPAPWDTTMTNRYVNPLLDVYPDGLRFNYSPDYTDIEYIADDDQQSFGVTRNIAGVLNFFAVTMPADGGTTEIYANDDPISVARYGIRPFQATWILNNPPVVDDLLAARAFATAQALPLRVSIDHEGFWPAMAMVDHLDPVTVIHQTNDDGLVVTGTGWIRNVVEERTWRGDGQLSWQSTIQIDIAATETAEALLPVEMLAFIGSESSILGTTSSAEFSWVNPTQPSITPTNVQYRILGSGGSLLWVETDYPGVGADGQLVNWLDAATAYRFQVRLIRRVDGVLTNFSAIREVRFTTAARIYPVQIPGEDPTDTDVTATPPDECDDFTVELQENDGSGWVTVDTFSGSELHDNGDGTYSLTYPIPNSFFNDGSMYRFRQTCDGIDYINGPAFDPPDDWTDPCTTPPLVSIPPYDDADLLVYVPQICAPDIIREYVSGIAGVHGTALAEIVAFLGGGEQRALLAIAQPEWADAAGGIVAYGECPQITGHTGSKTISARVSVADAEFCVFFECAGLRLTCTPDGGGWKAGAIAFAAPGTATVLSSALLLDTEYWITATYNADTGDLTIFVDGTEDNDTTFGVAADTIAALPIWRVGAPPESYVTDCAIWDRILAAVEMPPPLANSITFEFTGSEQTWVVPGGVTEITATLEGAQGSSIPTGGTAPTPGYGGRIVSKHTVTPGETIRVYVGGTTDGTVNYKQGGWPNGGNAQSGGNGGGGGGGSDIRQGGATTADRIVAVGGGSGAAAGFPNGQPNTDGADGAGNGAGQDGVAGSTTPSGAGQGGQTGAGGTGGTGDNTWGSDNGTNGTTAGQGGDGGEFHASGGGGGKTGGGGGGGGLGPASGGGGSGGVFSGTLQVASTGSRTGHGRIIIQW